MAPIARDKGQRTERKGRALLTAQGYTVFPIFQPPYHAQGPFDAIAVKPGEIKFIQFRSNRWGELKLIHAFKVDDAVRVTKEIWRFDDYMNTPKIRRM